MEGICGLSEVQVVSLHRFPPSFGERIADRFPNVRYRELPPESMESNQAEVLFCWGERQAPVLAACTDLKWVQALSVGVEHLVPSIPSEVTLTCARGVRSSAVAEHAFAMILSLTRHLPVYVMQQQARLWKGQIAHELRGQVLGIVGLGDIGRSIARLGQAFGMRVEGVNSNGRAVASVRRVYAPNELPLLLKRSHVVVLALPVTARTRGLIDSEALRAMRPGSLIVNISRGAVLDQTALMEALSSGRLAGAGLDVFEHEPLPEHHPLWGDPRVVLTPHVAAHTHEEVNRLGNLVLDNLGRYLEGRPLRHVVSPARGY